MQLLKAWGRVVAPRFSNCFNPSAWPLRRGDLPPRPLILSSSPHNHFSSPSFFCPPVPDQAQSFPQGGHGHRVGDGEAPRNHRQ